MSDIEEKLKASRDAALRTLNRTETWWERNAGWLGWAIAGTFAAVIVILCRSCT